MTRDRFLAKAETLADTGLFVGGVLVSLVFFNYFYHYVWTQQRQFSRPSDIVLYCVFPFGLAVFLFASLKFRPLQKINLLIFFMTFAGSAFGAELFLESWYPSGDSLARPVMYRLADSKDVKKDAAALTKHFGVEIDTRTSDEVIADLQKDGVDAAPIISPSNHLFIRQGDGSIKSAIRIDGRELMPLAGLSNKDTLLCNEGGRWIDYRSDEHGFNNSNEIWQSDRLEIAALGDSFAHGYCVPSDKNFVGLIRQRYPATLNLGVAGNGPLLMLATLKEYVTRFRPKIVLWFYYEGNDLTDLQTEKKSALLMDYLKDGFTQPDLTRQSDIDLAIMHQIPRLKGLEEDKRRERQANQTTSKFVNFAKLSFLRERLGLSGGVDADQAEVLADLKGPNMNLFRDILFQAKSEVDGWGGHLYFVYLPEWIRYTHATSWGISAQGKVENLVGNLGIPIIRVDSVFAAASDPLSLFPFRAVGHYNKTGHRLVAEEVLKVISKERNHHQ